MPDVTVRRSRRALLGSMVAGFAAATANLLGRAMPAVADDDGPVMLGASNTSEASTRIRRTTGGPAVVADASGPGVGLAGSSESGIAVYGVAASGKGVVGTSADGIALEGASADGIALHVPHGRVRLAGVSGVVRIAAGDVVAIVRPAARIPPDAAILLTPGSELGGRDLWFEWRREADAFAVRISETSAQDVHVAWLMLG